MPPRRNRAYPCAAVLAAATLALLTASGAEGSVKFEIDGAGLGHGVGMSQYGALGYAQHGRGHEGILEHYYTGARVGHTEPREVRVLLEAGAPSIRFARAERACGKELDPARRYEFVRDDSAVVLRTRSGRRLVDCGTVGEATGDGPVKLLDEGPYRGALVARVATGSGLNAINAVGIEGYLKGVIANEMPPSWPGAALRSQADTARSYALATTVNGDGFDLYDDTRSQVYGGKDAETPATNTAVKRTRGEVVKHDGGVIVAYFFSTSGGRTENVEFGFPGASARPYLKSVRDPYDDISPYHRWQVVLSREEMQNRLAGLVQGRLREIEVTKRGISPRIVEAKLIGSAGNTHVSGETLRFRLGLASTWARFEKVSG